MTNKKVTKTTKKKLYTYDCITLSDVEIVAPGIKQNQSFLQARALRKGMQSADTREIIERLTRGNLKIKASQAPHLLRATAELLKAKRATKATADTALNIKPTNGMMTIEQVQRIQNEFYKRG